MSIHPYEPETAAENPISSMHCRRALSQGCIAIPNVVCAREQSIVVLRGRRVGRSVMLAGATCESGAPTSGATMSACSYRVACPWLQRRYSPKCWGPAICSVACAMSRVYEGLHT